MMKSRLIAPLILLLMAAPPAESAPAASPQGSSQKSSQRPPRVLKFSGVPMSQANAIRKRFPFVFEREVSLAEVDEIVRWLMGTGDFSHIEVVERPVPGNTHERELVLVANLLRRVHDIQIEGNEALSTSDVLRILNISQGQIFERKDLIASADDLRQAYERLGYHNTKVEIDFDLPNDNEVRISIRVTESAPVRVQDVLVDTANPELAARLMRMGRELTGRVLTEDELTDFQKSVNSYLQRNRYLMARLSTPQISYNADRTRAKLNYAVDHPMRFEFLFDGNQHFTDGAILRQLEVDKLSGAVSSPAPDLAEKIRRLYQAIGFANVEVDYQEKILESSHLRQVRFSIREGVRVRIRRIEVTGNVSRPEKYYARFIKSSSSDLIGAGFYNRKDIDEGGKRLIAELQNQGFLRARIQSSRAEYSKDRAFVTIHLVLDEGPLTQIRQVKFEGVEAFPKAQLLESLKIRSGASLSLKDLEESIQALKDFYRNEGFLEMKILNENEKDRIVTYNDTNTQANVEFQIHEGPRVTVASVSIQGNSFTKDHVIRRELAFEPGDVLTPEKIDESTFHLQRLGLFSRVDIRTLEEGTNIASRTVLVEVSERDPGLFTLGLGVNNDWQVTYRGYLGLAYRNLGGTGRAVSGRLDLSYPSDPRISFLENKATVSYLEPYIFGGHNRGRINLTHEQVFPGYFDASDRTVIQESNTLGLLLERDLTRHFKLTYTGYSFSNQRKFDRRTFETLETQNIAKTGPLFELDYRDDTFNPTTGSYSFLNFEYSDPRLGSSEDEKQTIHFVKTNVSATTYTRLLGKKDLVWANSVRGGYLKNVSNNSNGKIPVQEAFFLGGRSTIRGFDPNEERIPNKVQLGVVNLSDFFVTDSSSFYLLKTELRFPISRNFIGLEVGGAIFYDGGAVLVWQPGVDIGDPYRDSLGFGFRIATPVGPLNLEIAWKLDRKTYTGSAGSITESPWAFHFSIGSF